MLLAECGGDTPRLVAIIDSKLEDQKPAGRRVHFHRNHLEGREHRVYQMDYDPLYYVDISGRTDP